MVEIVIVGVVAATAGDRKVIGAGLRGDVSANPDVVGSPGIDDPGDPGVGSRSPVVVLADHLSGRVEEFHEGIGFTESLEDQFGGAVGSDRVDVDIVGIVQTVRALAAPSHRRRVLHGVVARVRSALGCAGNAGNTQADDGEEHREDPAAPDRVSEKRFLSGFESIAACHGRLPGRSVADGDCNEHSRKAPRPFECVKM